MIQALRTSATGLQGQQGLIDVTANNIANVDTTAFKRNRADFQDLFYVAQRALAGDVAVGTIAPAASQVGLGTLIGSTNKQFTPGPLQNTEAPLDVAIEGNGFFRVTLPDGGLRYTRDGAFQIDAAGQLLTADGLIVQPPVTIPINATSVSIGPDGTVTAVLPGQTTPQVLGQLTLANFRNPEGLESIGNNLYAQTPASGAPRVGAPGRNGTGFLRQGTLEGSNVDVVAELTNLILGQRAYTFNAEAIRVANDMLRSTLDLLG